MNLLLTVGTVQKLVEESQGSQEGVEEVEEVEEEAEEVMGDEEGSKAAR